MNCEIKVKIEGTGGAGLLMHSTRGMLKALKAGARKKTEVPDPEEEAELSAYWVNNSTKKELCVPANVLYAAMIRASSFFKVKGRSIAGTLAGSMRIEPFNIGLGTNKYEVDIQFVNLGTGRARAKIARARARLQKWNITFSILYDDTFVAADTLKSILDEAGVKVGIMDFRPACKGQYGTFKVTQWKKVK